MSVVEIGTLILFTVAYSVALIFSIGTIWLSTTYYINIIVVWYETLKEKRFSEQHERDI